MELILAFICVTAGRRRDKFDPLLACKLSVQGTSSVHLDEHDIQSLVISLPASSSISRRQRGVAAFHPGRDYSASFEHSSA